MKRHAPATARNAQVIADVLVQELPDSGTVLEVASGTGEHAVFMARRFPHLTWQPSDPDDGALASIATYRAEAQLPNLHEPVLLDAKASAWPVAQADAIVCINMVHISPWGASVGLFAAARHLLDRGGPLVLYGPYLEEAVETTASNLAFDESLKARDAQWGLRRIEDMDALAADNGFERTARHVMPANNLTLVYRRT